MTGVYLKCDGCGATLDRYPKEIEPNNGSFGKLGGGQARQYAASIGWKVGRFYADQDYCPACSSPFFRAARKVTALMTRNKSAD